jgi:hypothetical protein
VLKVSLGCVTFFDAGSPSRKNSRRSSADSDKAANKGND